MPSQISISQLSEAATILAHAAPRVLAFITHDDLVENYTSDYEVITATPETNLTSIIQPKK